MLLLHIAALWALLQGGVVREVLRQAKPLFVSFVNVQTEAPTLQPPVSTRARAPDLPAVHVVTPLPNPLQIAQTPPAAEAAQDAAPVAAAAELPAVGRPPPAAPTPSQQPKQIPASAVQFIEALAPDYPKQSKRNGESGTVVVRAYIDASGVPRDLQIERSSGFLRLDQSALAAVQKARFKPYTENGTAVAGWARIPVQFDLEQ